MPGTPLTVGTKLDSLGGIQQSESGVEALLRLVTEVLEVRFHLDCPFDPAERAVARDDDFRN